jgi:hypothetical protein
MKTIFYLLYLILLFTNSENLNKFIIERKHKVLVNNENCDISFDYPEVASSDFKINLSELNELLYRVADYEWYSFHCDDTARTVKKIITGGYNILLQNDSLISIEYFTYQVHPTIVNNEFDTIYHTLVINTKTNLNKRKESENLFFDLIAQPLPGFDRGKLYPYVEKFNRSRNKDVNLLAYQSGSNYSITWAITKDSFVLYVGGEGEFCGYNKIIIPFNELTK